MFAELLGQLAIVATFVQKVIAFVKPAYKDTEYQKWIDLGLSIAVSALLCLAWNVDAFAVAGIALPLVWLGSVLTGVVAGLGANVLNDFLTLLEMWKSQKKLDVANKAADLQLVTAVAANEEQRAMERGS